MKIGYRICIEKNLTTSQKEVADKAIQNFIEQMSKDPTYIKGRGGYHSYFGVNRLGWGWEGLKEQGLLLRRVSKGRRIFAVMRACHLTGKHGDVKGKNGTEIIKGCVCPRGHGTNTKNRKDKSDEFVGYDRYVISSLPYSLQDFHTVYETGDIRG